MGRKKTDKPTTAVRIHAELLKMVAVIAAYEGKDKSDVISEILEGPLRKRFAEVLKKLHEE